MKKKTKLLIIIIASILTLAAAGTIIYLKFKPVKEKEETPIEVSVLEVITPLSENDSAKASELIKENIVKVINKLDDKNTITGTGFFDKSGYLVTNSHIVDIKGELLIEYPDGSTSHAQIFSNDITSDIALLAVENPKVKALYYGETVSLKVTDTVYAIGFPFALEGEASVTKGILSARRTAGGIEFLQSDISLNTGNSGGPLINEKAELLGINTYATENASIGMSISSESMQILIEKLIKDGNKKYLEEKRPENALSAVLTEIGYETKDIYNEEKYLNNENILKDNGNGKNHQNSGGDKKNSEYTCEDKKGIYNNGTVTIPGYYTDLSYYDFMHDNSKLVLMNNESEINISISYKGKVKSGSDLNIKNNTNIKPGVTTISGFFGDTGDCGLVGNFELHVIKPYTDPTPVQKVETTAYAYQCSNGNGNCYFVTNYLRDIDNIEVYPKQESDFYFLVPLDASAYNYVKTTFYYTYQDEENNEKEILLKSYDFNNNELTNSIKEIPTSEIRNLYSSIEKHNYEFVRVDTEISFKNYKTFNDSFSLEVSR